jgi:hypothetical protein
MDRFKLLGRFQKLIGSKSMNTSSFVNMFDGRMIEGMKLVIPGKSRAIFQLFRLLLHITKVKWQKLLRPSLYGQKFPHHYLGAWGNG